MSNSVRKFQRANGHRPPGEPQLALGDRVRLIGGPDTHRHEDGTMLAFRDYAVLGVITGNGLHVVLLAEWEKELAQVWAFPAGKLVLHRGATMWLGEFPSALILPG